jgi:hypothetical protein
MRSSWSSKKGCGNKSIFAVKIFKLETGFLHDGIKEFIITGLPEGVSNSISAESKIKTFRSLRIVEFLSFLRDLFRSLNIFV